MKIFYINDIYDKNNNASYKAKADIISIIKKHFDHVAVFDFYRVAIHIGYNRLVMAVKGRFLFRYNLLNFNLFQRKIKEGDVVIVSFPFEYRWFENFAKFIYHKLEVLKKERKVKVIFFLHDLNSIRTPGHFDQDMEIKVLSIADVIISHNPVMSDWLVSKGLDKSRLVDFLLWDYLSVVKSGSRQNTNANQTQDKTAVIYAGNLAPWKSGFIYKWQPQHEVRLYGENFVADEINADKIMWKGVFDANTPQIDIEGRCFGLVWDGASAYGLEEAGKYLKMNNPHKTGLYLSLGLPIIVHEEAANATFVKENGIGFTIKCLQEIENIISTIGTDEYSRYKENAKKISIQVKSGYYLSRAFQRAFEKAGIAANG